MEYRRLQNTELRKAAEELGLQAGREILVQERSLLKDCRYITRQMREGVVVSLYGAIFAAGWQMDGRNRFGIMNFWGMRQDEFC